jgi:tetratricopeptide (TPR) repeat protein
MSEINRAVKLDPTNPVLLAFLKDKASDPTFAGTAIIFQQAQLQSNPDDPDLLLEVGDSYWKSGEMDQAQSSYLKASSKPGYSAKAYAHLARLYVSTRNYTACLDSLDKSGDSGYALALQNIAQQADNLISNIDLSLKDFQSGVTTRTQFYDKLAAIDKQASQYSAFVSKINYSKQYKLSGLHRKLAASFIAQITPDLENYALTAQSSYLSDANNLEQNAKQELSTADSSDHIASN